jgi:hypothetical protein
MRINLFISMLLIVSMMGADAFAQSSSSKPKSVHPEFEFRGRRIGDDINKAFPKGDSRNYCNEQNSGIGIVSCNDPDVERNAYGYSSKYVGDVKIILLTYKFFDGALFSLDMGLGTGDFSNIRGMLIGKYGNPDREKMERVQNRLGAGFDNLVSEWEFKEGTLRLMMRFPDIETSWLEFDNPTVSQAIAERKKSLNMEKGKSVF